MTNLQKDKLKRRFLEAHGIRLETDSSCLNTNGIAGIGVPGYRRKGRNTLRISILLENEAVKEKLKLPDVFENIPVEYLVSGRFQLLRKQQSTRQER